MMPARESHRGRPPETGLPYHLFPRLTSSGPLFAEVLRDRPHKLPGLLGELRLTSILLPSARGFEPAQEHDFWSALKLSGILGRTSCALLLLRWLELSSADDLREPARPEHCVVGFFDKLAESNFPFPDRGKVDMEGVPERSLNMRRALDSQLLMFLCTAAASQAGPGLLRTLLRERKRFLWMLPAADLTSSTRPMGFAVLFRAEGCVRLLMEVQRSSGCGGLNGEEDLSELILRGASEELVLEALEVFKGKNPDPQQVVRVLSHAVMLERAGAVAYLLEHFQEELDDRCDGQKLPPDFLKMAASTTTGLPLLRRFLPRMDPRSVHLGGLLEWALRFRAPLENLEYLLSLDAVSGDEESLWKACGRAVSVDELPGFRMLLRALRELKHSGKGAPQFRQKRLGKLLGLCAESLEPAFLAELVQSVPERDFKLAVALSVIDPVPCALRSGCVENVELLLGVSDRKLGPEHGSVFGTRAEGVHALSCAGFPGYPRRAAEALARKIELLWERGFYDVLRWEELEHQHELSIPPLHAALLENRLLDAEVFLDFGADPYQLGWTRESALPQRFEKTPIPALSVASLAGMHWLLARAPRTSLELPRARDGSLEGFGGNWGERELRWLASAGL